MRLTQVVLVESYTVSVLYTESFHGNCVFDGRIEMHFITRSVLFIIRSILLLLFRSIFFICNYFRVKETYTNNSKLVPCYQLNR